MKKAIIAVIMSVASQAMACPGGQYEGDVQVAWSATNKTLNCLYNGVTSAATVTVDTPRCIGAKSTVTLHGFDDEIEVTDMLAKTIHGIARYSAEYQIQTNKSDSPIVCRD
jgi:hypothetical protein